MYSNENEYVPYATYLQLPTFFLFFYSKHRREKKLRPIKKEKYLVAFCAHKEYHFSAFDRKTSTRKKEPPKLRTSIFTH